MKSKTCFILVGPTAVGKTDVAIQLAHKYSTQIISADSRQCFNELNAGVAKPSPSQLNEVHHYFINSHSIHEDVNAITFEEYSLLNIEKIFADSGHAVMVGGTGLYIKAFCEGLDTLPPIDPDVRKKISSTYQEMGFEWLHSEVEKKDSLYFSTGEIKNPQRLMRALEVKISTGKSILDFQSGKKKNRDFNIIKVGLELPRNELNARIDQRIDRMLASGLVEEARSLYSFKELNALKTVGYRELFDFIDGTISYDEAIMKIKTNTHRYAKRQMTWFKKDTEIVWKYPDEVSLHLDFLNPGL